MNSQPVLAVIGGSGLYDFPALESIEQVNPATPFGHPSAPILVGTLSGKRVAFLARHGIGHTLPPSEVNYRANIYALKSIGVNRIISVSACGSLREDFAPGNIVVPTQLFDHTHARIRSFFESGLVVHVSSADPFCPELSTLAYQAISKTGVVTHLGGSMITIEGPRFSTKAESNVYRSWGMSLIGMTTSPEAFLAREAEMCYSVMAHVTDFDVWHLSEEAVSVEMVIQTLKKNTEILQQSILTLVENLPLESQCSCHHALRDAIITNRANISPESIQKLELLVQKYLK
mgnify:CR=1 FL=1